MKPPQIEQGLAELVPPEARLTPIALELPEAMGYEAWVAVGSKLCRAEALMKWWLGDWAAFGLRKYGQLKEFAAANHINYQTLRNAAWVSQAVALSRRRDSLEWSVHAEVAGLKPAEQAKWLAKAESDRLPVAELRRQIRVAQGERNALESDGPVVKFVVKALDDLVHWLVSRPGDFWEAERKRVWKERLRPVVEFWEKL